MLLYLPVKNLGQKKKRQQSPLSSSSSPAVPSRSPRGLGVPWGPSESVVVSGCQTCRAYELEHCMSAPGIFLNVQIVLYSLESMFDSTEINFFVLLFLIISHFVLYRRELFVKVTYIAMLPRRLSRSSST